VNLSEMLLIVRRLVKNHRDGGRRGATERAARASLLDFKIKLSLQAPPPTPAPSLISKGRAPTPMEGVRRALERVKVLVRRHREGGATRRARRVLARSRGQGS
jgi:hypothetical protein